MKFVMAAALVTACTAQRSSPDDIWMYDFRFRYNVCVTFDKNLMQCHANTTHTYDSVVRCLKEHAGDDCLQALSIFARNDGVFTPKTTCSIATHGAQELDTKDFFVSFPEFKRVVSVTTEIFESDDALKTKYFTVNFDENVDENACIVQLEFLPHLISDCASPKNNNAPVAIAEATPSSNRIRIGDVFKNRQCSSILVTSGNWTACGTGVASISYITNAGMLFEGFDDYLTDASVATSAAAGITVVTAIAALW